LVAIGKSSRQRRVRRAIHVPHLLRLLAGIVIVVELYLRVRTHRQALLGIIADIVGQGGIADRPEIAVREAHADGAHRGIALVAPVVAAIHHVAIGEVAFRGRAENAVEHRLAFLVEIGARAGIAAETGHFLQDRLALLRHSAAGVDRLGNFGKIVAQPQNDAGELLALARQLLPCAGRVVTPLADILAFRRLHIALQLPRGAGIVLHLPEVAIAVELPQRVFELPALGRLGIDGLHIERKNQRCQQQQNRRAESGSR
jgi:hypothetical protein